MSRPNHKVLPNCNGEKCSMCGVDATHKVYQDEEEAVSEMELDGVSYVVPHHPLTAYVCCVCFRKIMGPVVMCTKKD